MKNSPISRIIAAAAMVPFLAGVAEAHTGHGQATGFIAGALHPLTGVDHILAMVAVGLLAAQLGGRALYAVPLSFMVTMALGGVLGFSGTELPFVELGIGASVLILGGLIAANVRLPTAAAMSLAASFALFHGFAHGAEVPANASGLGYVSGFVTVTGVLHLTGLALGLAAAWLLAGRGALTRVAGGAIAVAGMGLLTGAI